MIEPGDWVIDATTGNGHDTIFLANLVGDSGKVLAFDVQEEAIRNASARLDAAGLSGRTEFLHRSHLEMERHAESESISVIMFNLGYLPGQNHEQSTTVDATLLALEISTRLIKPEGVISVICYPGHPAGMLEAKRIEDWVGSVTENGWRAAKYSLPGTRKPAPFLVILKKPEKF